MSRTRLAAAAGVAALTLGATAAVADPVEDDDSQTVTITVTASPRSISVTDPTDDLEVVAGGAADDSVTGAISFDAGASAAKITIELMSLTESDQAAYSGGLTLEVESSGLDSEVVTFEDIDFASASPIDFLTGIGSGTSDTDVVSYTLRGTAQSDPGSFDVEFLFTITDDTA